MSTPPAARASEQYHLVLKWGSEGEGDGQFISASDVTVDAKGNVYVADRGNNRIQKFTSGGVFDTKWSAAGSEPSLFWPMHVTSDLSGHIYVRDARGFGRILKYTEDGTFVTSVQWPDVKLEDLDADPAGYIYCTGEKWVSGPSGWAWVPVVWKLESNLTGGGGEWGTWRDNDAVAVDRSGGYVYAADERYSIVSWYDLEGNPVDWRELGAQEGPCALATDADGNLFVGERLEHRVRKFAPGFAPDGTPLAIIESDQLGSPNGIAVDRSGSVYVAEDSCILKFSRTAYLSQPWVRPSIPSRYRTFSIYGYLKPYHSGYTRVYFQRRLRYGGRWIWKWLRPRYRWARNYRYWSYTRYRLAYRLGGAGYYRVRAYHGDSAHYPTYSSWRVFRVR